MFINAVQNANPCTPELPQEHVETIIHTRALQPNIKACRAVTKSLNQAINYSVENLQSNWYSSSQANRCHEPDDWRPRSSGTRALRFPPVNHNMHCCFSVTYNNSQQQKLNSFRIKRPLSLNQHSKTTHARSTRREWSIIRLVGWLMSSLLPVSHPLSDSHGCIHRPLVRKSSRDPP